MTTRTSMPRRRSALGRAPATSARPPVLRNGVTSEATYRTLSATPSGRVQPVVDVREDVVAGLQVGEIALVDGAAARELVIELGEADDVLVESPRRVRDRGAGRHD